MRAADADEMIVPESTRSPAWDAATPFTVFSIIPFVLVVLFAYPAFSTEPDDILDENFDIEELASDADATYMEMIGNNTDLFKTGRSAYGDTNSCMRFFPGTAVDIEKHIRDQMQAVFPHKDTRQLMRTGVRYQKSGEEPFGRYWNRYLGNYGKGVKATLLVEHDPGEPRAFDLVSGSLTIPVGKDFGIVAGDYRPSFGEGLVFSRHLRRYRSGTDVMQRTPVNPANVSFEETRFLRGAFVKAGGERYTGEAWVSRRTLYGIEDDGGDIVSIDSSGLHGIRSRRADVKERIGAAKMTFVAHGPFAFSLLGAMADYSPGFLRRTGEPGLNDPEGDRFQYLSWAGVSRDPRKTFYFEHARMNGGVDATVAGLRIARDRFSGVLAARSYDRGWWSFHSGAISAFGETSGERGVYAAIETGFSGSTSANAAIDLARRLGRTYSQPMPVSRKDIRLGLNGLLPRDFEYGLVFTSSSDSDGDPGRWSVRARCSMNEKSSRFFSARATTAWSSCGGDGGPFAEMGCGFKSKKVRFDIDAGVFAIPYYSARFYRYERDVPGRGMTLPVWGKGGSCVVRAGMGNFTIRYRHADSDLMKSSSELTIQGDWSW